MKINMKDMNPGMWFAFEPDNPDSGEICIRVLNGEKLAAIRNNTVKTKVEYREDNRFEYQDIDHTARDNIIWDYCIVDWKGLTDDDDNPIECNTEKKIELMNGHVGFSLFVENCMQRVNKQNDVYREYSEKNL